MATNYEKIKTCIEKSDLSSADKLAVTESFAEISDDFLEEIAELFQTKPEWIAIYHDNKMKKTAAYESGDEEAWNIILEQEKKILEKLTFDSD